MLLRPRKENMVSSRLLISLAGLMGLLLSTALPAQEHPEGHHHSFPRDVDAFHAVLAPLWHQPAGIGRLQEACAQAPKLEGVARQIRSRNAEALVTAIANLKTRCQSAPDDAEAALTAVHDAFHGLIRPATPAKP